MVERTADGRIRTTQWEDIQYKHGNRVGQYVNHELDIMAQRIGDKHINSELQPYDPTAEKLKDKEERGNPAGDDVGEDDDDDGAIAAYRQRRLAELQKQQGQVAFGRVRSIRGSDYVTEVTNSSTKCCVVVLLSQEGHAECRSLREVFDSVSAAHTDIKFVEIPATEAIPNFPMKHLPCVLVYWATKMVQQVTGMDTWGGSHGLSPSTVEAGLRKLGVLPEEKN